MVRVDQHHRIAALQQELEQRDVVVPGRLDPDQDIALVRCVLLQEATRRSKPARLTEQLPCPSMPSAAGS